MFGLNKKGGVSDRLDVAKQSINTKNAPLRGENNVVELKRRDKSIDRLPELLVTGTRQLIERYLCWQTVGGKAAVVHNGYLPERNLQMALGSVTVRIPKVCSKTGEPVTFRSALEVALLWLYLKGVSSGEIAEALKVLVGPDAEKAFDLFIRTYEPKYPKATLCLQKDREALMAFSNFPAQHWQSIRT